ncbi:MAG: TetR family transcriptional regulator [Actinobacteria bacterium]|nr:TetR family transcriptional regulator [Actinomycetota bacterium]MBI3688799.1 TetR family transcriptional regulator [Actinomycetota bacterium]
MTSQADDRPRQAGGLRERKKAKTRLAIQQHAVRLFREQGYAATTIDQIAEAAEVSPSTFFRYFPAKEDVVLYDPFDPLIIDAYRTQPAELGPIAALRAAVRAVVASMPAERLAPERDRQALILATPELRSKMLDELVRTLDLFATIVAERVDRDPEEYEVRTLVGAVIGVAIAAWRTAGEDLAAFVALFEAGLEHLETGLQL